MALGDLMASRFSSSQSSSVAVVSNHYDDYSSGGGGDDVIDLRRDRDSDTASTSNYNAPATGTTATATTSMAYLPQTVVLCELRHEAFEVSVPTGPSDSGLVSKWWRKDRVRI